MLVNDLHFLSGCLTESIVLEQQHINILLRIKTAIEPVTQKNIDIFLLICHTQKKFRQKILQCSEELFVMKLCCTHYDNF